MAKLVRKLRLQYKVAYKVYLLDYLLSWLGGFMGIAILGLLNSLIFSSREVIMLIGSFGASAILLYGEFKSPLSQPRNLVGGHIVSALVGVTIALLPVSELWISAALAVSLALLIMKLTSTTHPPGGATALIAVIGGEKITSMGYWYVLFPVGTGAVILLIVAVLLYNISGLRKYPDKWF
ncbi:HPP family protein [Cytophagaceae bacterium ABcell3]|nr:HPP family protein [Cytophagaceae bacterium ABcell3]